METSVSLWKPNEASANFSTRAESRVEESPSLDTLLSYASNNSLLKVWLWKFKNMAGTEQYVITLLPLYSRWMQKPWSWQMPSLCFSAAVRSAWHL